MAEKIKKELFEDYMTFIKLVGEGGVRIFVYGPGGDGDDGKMFMLYPNSQKKVKRHINK